MPTFEMLQQATKELPDTTYNHARLHVKGEWCVGEGCRITLKANARVNDKIATKNIGSCRFGNGQDTNMPSTSWLYIDMLHLIMLMAEHMEADMATVKLWHSEANALLSNMGKEL